ncbi:MULTISPECIES: hypothetical protein [Aeromonas]|uniref:hypothetical protein n=1 Tax=Aeromonas TaxID=642 RepID=UPI00051AE53A|nr:MULTISPECIES: hypothetical protein [Aeromonas]MCH7371705.1 hypothetical protein [Aeromonas sp. MR16]
MLLLLQGVWMGWLFAFPVALDSDDALNFAHGVARFSVLEFSPHFPGYPAFIWFARLIHLVAPDPASAVQWASLLGSSLLPPLSALLAVRLWQRSELLAPVWLGTIALPLTPTLALSGLSDGPALAAWLGALLALHSSSSAASASSPRSSRRLALAGLLLGLLLALRPSYFVLALLPLWQGWQHKGQRLHFAAPIALVGLACLLFVWQADGWAYFAEGRRFTDGHFHLWGNTAAAHGSRLLSWGQTLNAQLSPLWPLLLWPLWRGARRLAIGGDRSWGIGWLALLLWTLLGQNPDNPRHLAPLVYLGLILLAGWLPAARSVVMAAMLGALALLGSTLIPPGLPAMSQAREVAEQRCPALVTQWGVRLLRESSPLPVTDGWYQGDARLALTQGACRLSRRPLDAGDLPGPYQAVWFAPRFRAEPGLWLALPR